MIDPARLQELAEDFGPDDLAELIEAFLEEASEAVDTLEATVSDAYSEDRAAQFHFLKGCALNVGASQFGERLQILEHRDGGFSQTEYQSLRAEFHAIQEHLLNGGLKNIA
ncbi:MAG: Hpt domain-containing protein [Pseudomonadota bacterium]